MSLLSYNKLRELIERGVINAPIENINGASIDITLDKEIRLEMIASSILPVIDLKLKHSLNLRPYRIGSNGFKLFPGQFMLASSRETFNLPDNIACEYKLKSSLARSGLQHMLAGWCDPTWQNSKLTLELNNVTQNHILILRHGMKIGQVVFFECEPVPDEYSYAVKGQYNNQRKVTENRGVR